MKKGITHRTRSGGGGCGVWAGEDGEGVLGVFSGGG
jgi:hypothetical protein